jgi:hypothetical protein
VLNSGVLILFLRAGALWGNRLLFNMKKNISGHKIYKKNQIYINTGIHSTVFPFLGPIFKLNNIKLMRSVVSIFAGAGAGTASKSMNV